MHVTLSFTRHRHMAYLISCCHFPVGLKTPRLRVTKLLLQVQPVDSRISTVSFPSPGPVRCVRPLLNDVTVTR